MENQLTIDISASDVRNYTICPFKPYAQIFLADRYEEPIVSKILAAQGILYEQEEIKNQATSLHPELPSPKIEQMIQQAITRNPRQTLRAINKGIELIKGPLECVIIIDKYLMHLRGIPDLLMKYEDTYSVLEIKLHKALKDSDIFQSIFYAFIFEKMTGKWPFVFVKTAEEKPFFITGPIEKAVFQMTYEKSQELVQALLPKIAEIKLGLVKPDIPYDKSSCKICGFDNYCSQIMSEFNYVNLVPGIGYSSAKSLTDVGIRTCNELACCDPKTISSKLCRNPYAARNIFLWQQQAQSIVTKTPIFFENPVVLPEHIGYWDIETMGLDPSIEPLIMIDLFDGKKHHHFSAKTLDDEPKMIEAFLKKVSEIKKPIMSYSGSYFDYRYVSQRCEICDIREFSELFPKENDIDFNLHLKRKCVLPVSRYGLKDVAGFFGFRWSNDISGFEVPIKYAQYLRTGNKKILAELEVYNKEDTEALHHVINALRKKAQGP